MGAPSLAWKRKRGKAGAWAEAELGAVRVGRVAIAQQSCRKPPYRGHWDV